MNEEEGKVKIGEVTISTTEYLDLKEKELREKHSKEITEVQNELKEIKKVLEKVKKDKGYLRLGSEGYTDYSCGDSYGRTRELVPEFIPCDEVTKEFLDKIEELTNVISSRDAEIKALKEDLLTRNEQVLSVLAQDKTLVRSYKLLQALDSKDYKSKVKELDLKQVLNMYARDNGFVKVYSRYDLTRSSWSDIELLPEGEEEKYSFERKYVKLDTKDFISWVLKNLPSVYLFKDEIISKEESVVITPDNAKGEDKGFFNKLLRKF